VTTFKLAPIQNGERLNDADRKRITDQLGEAGSAYRTKIYHKGFEGSLVQMGAQTLRDFITQTLAQLDHTIQVNRRPDGLYHAYNIMSMDATGVQVENLDEMLEGQVAVLSSGALSVQESLALLNALRFSALYRPDQNSYILYPNRQLPGYLQKNTIPESLIHTSKLLTQLVENGDFSLIQKDIKGHYHFNGNFRNVADVYQVLDTFKHHGLTDIIEAERPLIGSIFEQVFNHKAFTGRSGTFYAYEGLGSIYWHMVSKLHLAVMEVCQRARREHADASIQSALFNHFIEIGAGIGVHKTPKHYGAFPTDPYSHTPYHRGAQQPGMTGQVKEDILVNWGEFGVRKQSGRLGFVPELLREELLTDANRTVVFRDIAGRLIRIEMPPDSLAFTCCQVPVIYTKAKVDQIHLKLQDGSEKVIQGLWLDTDTSEKIFKRTGELVQIQIDMTPAHFIV
jgi:hypothetical protein